MAKCQITKKNPASRRKALAPCDGLSLPIGSIVVTFGDYLIRFSKYNIIYHGAYG